MGTDLLPSLSPPHPQASMDRLSALSDADLARVLSHLMTDEAVRTSVLARRWRRVYAAVPVIQLVDRNIGAQGRYVSTEKVCFEQQVTSALLSRDPRKPIRALRLDAQRPTPCLLDQWILAALLAGAEDVDVLLDHTRRKLCPFRASKRMTSADFEDDVPYHVTPGHLFRSAALRHLRLTYWRLRLPGAPSLPSLETLYLKKISAHDGELQRLVSACPRLEDLTLKECPSVTDITVASAHLRRFAMVCCHHATSVVVLDAPSLTLLHYKGGLPHSSFFSVANCAGIVTLTIDICEDLAAVKTPPPDFAPVRELVARCTGLTDLRLSLRPRMAYLSDTFTRFLGVSLHNLTQLSLKGCLPSRDTVSSVAALLQATNNLQVLSLFPLPPEPRKERYYSFYDPDYDEPGYRGPVVDYGYTCDMYVPKKLWRTPIRCLNRKLRRINLVKYSARPLERMLTKFLLSKAAVLKEFSVTFAAGCCEHEVELTWELASWLSNQSAQVLYWCDNCCS